LFAAGSDNGNELKVLTPNLLMSKFKFTESNVKMIKPIRNQGNLESLVISYDELVIALGSSTKYFNIFGAIRRANLSKNHAYCYILTQNIFGGNHT
jgi:NADH:ubiquinone reductase (H+-translocating)